MVRTCILPTLRLIGLQLRIITDAKTIDYLKINTRCSVAVADLEKGSSRPEPPYTKKYFKYKSWISETFIKSVHRLHEVHVCTCRHDALIYTYTHNLHTHYICMHGYIHAYIHTYMRAYIYRDIHTFMHTCIDSYIHICMNTYMYYIQKAPIITLTAGNGRMILIGNCKKTITSAT